MRKWGLNVIGKMERVDLREVWKNEVRNFISWLFDNIDILGDELSVSITPIEKEKNVGSFSCGRKKLRDKIFSKATLHA